MTYLYVMPEKSTGAEALLKKAADLMAAKLAERMVRIADMDTDDAALVREIDAAARAGRNIDAMQVAIGKAIRSLEALDAPASDNKETPMNDDASGASDRLEQLHAELDRRLDAVARSVELKRLEGRADRSGDSRVSGRLAPVEPPASKAA